MGNYRNEVENTEDYLGRETPMYRELMNLPDMPEGEELMTHVRMMYGHVDWSDMIVELDRATIGLLQEHEACISIGENVMRRLRTGKPVALIDGEAMGAVSYSMLKTGSGLFEVLDLEEAKEQAARWFVEDLYGSGLRFPLFVPYVLLAFRLALMEGTMKESERFARKRLCEVWRETWAQVMFRVGMKLVTSSGDIETGRIGCDFELLVGAVERYLEKEAAE